VEAIERDASSERLINGGENTRSDQQLGVLAGGTDVQERPGEGFLHKTKRVEKKNCTHKGVQEELPKGPWVGRQTPLKSGRPEGGERDH